MARSLRILSVLLLPAGACACSGEPAMRDFYWGKGFLQPELVEVPAKRDRLGNAIIEERRGPPGDLTSPKPGTQPGSADPE